MKLFKKLTIAFACALCAAGVCLSFAACGESNPDANLPEDTYVFYVYLEDGTTPVEGAILSICYNTETSSVCLATPAVTDSNGRAEADLSSVADEIHDSLCVHFTMLAGDTSPVGFPDGYTYPANSQTITLNEGEYSNAWYITEQVTTFKLVKE